MKTGFFEESQGVKSSTRLNSFILLIFFCIVNFMWINAGNNIDGNLLVFDMIVLVGVFAPKYLHKIIEMKIGTVPAKEDK